MSDLDTSVGKSQEELKPLKENEEGEEKVKKTSYAWVWGIVIFILIVLLVILIVYLILRSRKSKCPPGDETSESATKSSPGKSMQVDESWCGSRRPKSPSRGARSNSIMN
jgi:hypothetical protein